MCPEGPPLMFFCQGDVCRFACQQNIGGGPLARLLLLFDYRQFRCAPQSVHTSATPHGVGYYAKWKTPHICHAINLLRQAFGALGRQKFPTPSRTACDMGLTRTATLTLTDSCILGCTSVMLWLCFGYCLVVIWLLFGCFSFRLPLIGCAPTHHLISFSLPG